MFKFIGKAWNRWTAPHVADLCVDWLRHDAVVFAYRVDRHRRKNGGVCDAQTQEVLDQVYVAEFEIAKVKEHRVEARRALQQLFNGLYYEEPSSLSAQMQFLYEKARVCGWVPPVDDGPRLAIYQAFRLIP